MTNTLTAIIYVRVSTSRQAEEGLPIESQIEQAQMKADQMGAKVLRIFRDEGISGRTSRRPAFQDAVAYCSISNVNLFIVWNTSRFARNKIDAASYKALLRQGGTKVVYAAAEIDGDTDEGWFSESIFEIVDEHYSRVISRDTKRSMMKNARDGFYNGGHIPFGYTTIPAGKRKRLAPDASEAPTIRDMFSMYLQGAGTKEISIKLNEAGRLKRGARWNKNTVNFILKNPVYTGLIVFNRRDHRSQINRSADQWITTRSHEPIISEEIFMNVMQIMEKRAPKESGGSPHSRFTFTGLLKCGQCGSSMQTESAKGRSSVYHYYNCRSAQKGIGCENRRIPAHEFDEWMISTILDRVLTRTRIEEMVREVHELRGEWFKERSRRRDEIVAELRSTEGKRDKIFELFELHGKDTPNLGDLTKRLRTHKGRIEELEASLLKLEEEDVPLVKIGDKEITEATTVMREIIATTTDPVRLRMFFSGFVDQIVLDGNAVRIEYNPAKILKPGHMDPVHSEISWLPELRLLRTKGASQSSVLQKSISLWVDLPVRWRLAA